MEPELSWHAAVQGRLERDATYDDLCLYACSSAELPTDASGALPAHVESAFGSPSWWPEGLAQAENLWTIDTPRIG